jgi:hypothetical protein
METKGQATMAKRLTGGISNRADREKNPDRDKPKCGTAGAYCLATQTEQIDLGQQTLMETKSAGCDPQGVSLRR